MNSDNTWVRHFISEELYILNEKDSDHTGAEGKESEKASAQLSEPKEVAVQVGKVDLEQQRDLLKKILKAIELDLDSVDVVIADTYETLPNNRVVCFGLETSMNLYELHDQSNQKILFADSLTSIAADRNKKVSLWENLKNFRNH